MILSHNNFITIPCYFYKLTGFYCPGCGMTRAIYNIVTLNFTDCFHNNLLVILLIPLLLYYLFCLVKNYLLTGKIISLDRVFPRFLIIIILIIVIVYGILRNIDFFSWMKPL